MIALPAEFALRAGLNDSEKMIIVKLFFGDGSSAIYVSTVSTTVDDVHYLGAISTITGSTLTWNFEDANSGQVTKSAPVINLLNYSTPDGDQLIELFGNDVFIGRNAEIYLGYQGMDNVSDFLPLFFGEIDDITLSRNRIKIKLKTNAIPDKIVAGRSIDYDKQEIGGSSIVTLDIPQERKDKPNIRLPLAFGLGWDAPVILYGEDEDYYYFAVSDKDYSSLLDGTQEYLKDYDRWNSNKTQKRLLVPDGDFYVPVTDHSWSDGTEASGVPQDEVEIYDDTDNNIHAIKLRKTLNDGTILRYDGKLFVIVPLRFRFDDQAGLDRTLIRDDAGSDPVTDVIHIYDMDRTTDFFVEQAVANEDSELRTRAHQEIDWNLRTNNDNSVFRDKKIHIQGSSSIGVFFNWDEINDQNSINFYLWVWTRGSAPATTSQIAVGLINANGLVTRLSSREAGSDHYDQNTYLAGDGTFVGFDVFNADGNAKSFPEDEDTAQTPMLGGELSNMDRVAFTQGLSFRNDLWMFDNITQAMLVRTWILHLGALGTIDFLDLEAVFGERDGVEVSGAAASTMLSVPGVSAYILRRPYQYLEFILRAIAGAETADFGSEWSSLSNDWEDLFSTSRDYSGFSIFDDTKLNAFLNEYVKGEPFAFYRDNIGDYRFLIIPDVLSGDADSKIVGTLDFIDADGGFELGQTPRRDIISEILSLKTDYADGLQEYCQDFRWRIPDGAGVGGGYNYDEWDSRNSEADNFQVLDQLEKRYSKSGKPDNVRTGTDPYQYFTCWKTIQGDAGNPNPNTIDQVGLATDGWRELPPELANTNDWVNTTDYLGEDAENYHLARYILNQYGNPHFTVNFKTSDLSYAQFSIGDIVRVANCPDSLYGYTLKGFKGETSTFTATKNGQTIYSAFMITSVKPDISGVEIKAVQLHKLTEFEPERLN